MVDVLAQGAGNTDQSWFWEWGLSVVVVLVVAILITIVIQVLVRRFRRKLEGSLSFTQELNLQRIATLTGALSTAGLAATWTIASLVVLGELGVNMAPIFASAGVVGVALSAPSRSRHAVRLLHPAREPVRRRRRRRGADDGEPGRREGRGSQPARHHAARVRRHAASGSERQHPGRQQQSRGWARAIVDVRVGYGEDVDRVRGVLEELFEEVRIDPSLSD